MPVTSCSFQLRSYFWNVLLVASVIQLANINSALSRHSGLTSEKAVLTHGQLIALTVPVYSHLSLTLLDSKFLEGEATLLLVLCGSDVQTQVVYFANVLESDHKEKSRRLEDQWKAFLAMRMVNLRIIDG